MLLHSISFVLCGLKLNFKLFQMDLKMHLKNTCDKKKRVFLSSISLAQPACSLLRSLFLFFPQSPAASSFPSPTWAAAPRSSSAVAQAQAAARPVLLPAWHRFSLPATGRPS